MGLREQIEQHIDNELRSNYRPNRTWDVPEITGVGLDSHGHLIETAVLYADLRRSSQIVDGHRRINSAKFIKSFLYAMARIARVHDGEIRAFDGDRIMVVFPPTRNDQKVPCNTAVRTAMEMVWCLREILEPKLRGYDSIDCGIGIAFGELLVVRAGLKSQYHNSGLVWIGRAANLAAKLSDKGRVPRRIWIDHEVYNRLDDHWKFNRSDNSTSRVNMWQAESNPLGVSGLNVYSSNYISSFS